MSGDDVDEAARSVAEDVEGRQPGLRGDRGARGVDRVAREPLVVDGDGHHRAAGDQLDGLDLALERVHRVARKPVVLVARRGVLQDDDVGPAGGQDLEAARVGGVHQAALALDDDDLGRRSDHADHTACSISPATKSLTRESRMMP